MENLWTSLKISGDLMVSDFRNLHCEGSCRVEVPAADIKPGYVVQGLASYCHGVKVVRTTPQWVQLEVGDKIVTVLSGQEVQGPSKPLSYAYGEMHISLKGKKMPAFELYSQMSQSQERQDWLRIFHALTQRAYAQADAWAAYLAAKSLVQPPYVLSKAQPQEKATLTRPLVDALFRYATEGVELEPVLDEVWSAIHTISSKIYYGAIDLRYQAETYVRNSCPRNWSALGALVSAAYVADEDLVAQILPHGKKGSDSVATVMALRAKQMRGEPYLAQLQALMQDGIWQAHFLYVLTFMPSPLALSPVEADAEQKAQLQASISFLADYYKKNDYNDFYALEAINLANYCRFCMDGPKALDYNALQFMDKGAYRGLPFSAAFYGIALAATASNPRDVDEAFKFLSSAADQAFLLPKKAYLRELESHGLDEPEQQLVRLAIAAYQ